ncbi:disease resistance protein SUMM2 [Eucalyptus grandis]|uniref:disease resistance protein SUMM2 n=1 Tax=Eucalyptus grandis TaxID=71139 RepID=UPI00192E94D0|nr:disease resistance protein SUMM2 [Eucalyptus grandis]
MAEVVLCAASTVAGCLVAPVNRLCGYVISYDSHVRELKAKIAELGNARQNVQDSIKDAQNNVKPIKAHVNKWMEDVEKDTGEAHRVLDDDERAKKTCFYRWLPKVRYRLGREARRKAEDIQGLIDRKPFGEVYDDPPPGLVDGTSDVISSAGDQGDTIFDSRASILEDIRNALDHEKHKVVGVYGPGGVGKTTLLEEVEKKLRKEGRPFDMIVKSKVSQTPDLNDIQYQIADDLNLNLKDKQSQVGEEEIFCLKDDEAFELFEKTVGDKLKDDEEFESNSASSRQQARSNVHTWRTMLIKIEEPNVETIVKLSYDHLKSKDAKTLFLLCGLIGGTIQVETLLVLGMGLGLFEEFRRTMQASRDRLNTILDELRSACLLLDDGNDKNNVTIHELLDDDDYKNNVTIHDFYSEVVVSTSFWDQNSLMMNSNYGSWSKEKLEKCWAICLADVDKKRFDELMMCQFPDLKILMLSQPKGWRWMGEHEHEVGDCSRLLDFTYMKELRVLYFHSMHITSLPPSIGILGNLHSLYLDCCDVKDVAILGKLKALQILSFAQSTISQLPKEIGNS